MSNDNTRPTSLEHLPVEIFLQIFGLLPFQEIVTAFVGLNSYIDSIIRSVTGVNHVLRYNNIKAINLLHLFSTQIRRLVIINADTVDFTALINLRSLILKHGTCAQFDGIRPQHFPMLEILHIYTVESGLPINTNSVTDAVNNLFEVILSNGFPRLRICTAVDIAPLVSSETWTGSPALRTLHLDMKTAHDYQQLFSACPNLRRFTSFGYFWNNLLEGFNRKVLNRRVSTELRKLERLELENKFIIDVNPMAVFGSNKPPLRFNNTATTLRSYISDGVVIQGRILPKLEPYCRASFLIQITLCQAYPFKQPDVIILDPIYHPNINEWGKTKESCSLDFALRESFRPTTSLSDFVEAIIRVVENITDSSYHNNYDCAECINEYQNNYQAFYEKALRLVLLYGRPRD